MFFNGYYRRYHLTWSPTLPLLGCNRWTSGYRGDGSGDGASTLGLVPSSSSSWSSSYFVLLFTAKLLPPLFLLCAGGRRQIRQPAPKSNPSVHPAHASTASPASKHSNVLKSLSPAVGFAVLPCHPDSINVSSLVNDICRVSLCSSLANRSIPKFEERKNSRGCECAGYLPKELESAATRNDWILALKFVWYQRSILV